MKKYKYKIVEQVGVRGVTKYKVKYKKWFWWCWLRYDSVFNNDIMSFWTKSLAIDAAKTRAKARMKNSDRSAKETEMFL